MALTARTILTGDTWYGNDSKMYGRGYYNRSNSPFMSRNKIHVKEGSHAETDDVDDLPQQNGYRTLYSLPGLRKNSGDLDSERGQHSPNEIELHPLEKGHDCSKEGCTRVVINVSGTKFETQLRTLNRFPHTLLGSENRRKKLWDESRNEYFIDRHRLAFQSILNFYQSGGRLKRPVEMHDEIFIEEMEYYELGDSTINAYKMAEGINVPTEDPMPNTKMKKRFWLLCEYPSSSILAKIVGVFSVVVILVSIVAFCLETIPDFEKLSCKNVTHIQGNVTEWENVADYSNPFFIIETVCIIWFSIELGIRLLACPSKLVFCKDIMNLFDFAAIAPYYIMLVVEQFVNPCGDSSVSLSPLRVIRLLRVTRVFKLSKHSTGLRILGLTIKASLKELAMFVFFLGISIILFSAMIYYAEFQFNASFQSIPEAFWWAIVTMTTIGYGDLVPITYWGKLVGGLCLIAGLLAIALPVPIIVTNFNNYYQRETGRGFN